MGTGYVLGVVVLLLAWYAVGVCIAWRSGVLVTFLEFYPGVVIFVGLGLVAVTVEMARARYVAILERWVHDFDPQYEKAAAEHWENLCDDRAGLTWAIPVAVFAGMYVVFLRLVPVTAFPVSPVIQGVIFGPLPLFVYTVILGAAVGFAAGVAVHFGWEIIRFIRQSSSQSLDSFEFVSAEADLTPMSDLITTVVVVWFVGIALCTVVLFQTVDWVSLGVYLAGVGAGLVIFCVPQWYIHRIIVNSKKRAKSELWARLPNGGKGDSLSDMDQESLTILGLIRETDSINEWTVDLRHVVTIVAGALFPYLLTISPILFPSH